MDITEVRIKLMDFSEDRLRAFCSITLDQAFVVRDLKIIEGSNGPFVAMPSRKMTARCGRCGSKNHMRSNFCNQCGKRLRGAQDLQDIEGASNKLYADIAHPVNQACRDLIQQAVIREYQLELERAEQPGYVSRYDEEYVEHIPHAVSTPSIIPRPYMLKEPAQEVSALEASAKDSSAKEASALKPAPTALQNEPTESPAAESSAGEIPMRREGDFGNGIF
ncbi:MAG: septation protein SpoVG family protein [Planctomycetota bacterium]|nr:septation protein SpoVG family protein [Planctomycetota bacterium]